MTHGFASGFTNQGEYIPDNLIAGEFPRVTYIVDVTGGAVLRRGAVLGEITADGRFQLSDVDAADGSEAPQVILAQDIDVTVNDQQAVVFFTGEFNELALQIGNGHTVDSIRAALRTRSIYLRTNIPA